MRKRGAGARDPQGEGLFSTVFSVEKATKNMTGKFIFILYSKTHVL